MCSLSDAETGSGELAPYDTNARGWWPYSRIKMAMPSYDVKPVLVDHYEPTFYQHCASGGPEQTAFAKQSVDTNGSPNGNFGLFGVDLYYEYTLTNSGSQTYPAWLAAEAMSSTNEYHGAAWDTGQTSSAKKYFDQLLLGTGYALGDITLDKTYYTTAGGQTSIELLCANGGGATMPFATVLSKLDYVANAGEGQ